MLLEAGFLIVNECSLGYILCHIFVGMLSILLHVDSKCYLFRSIMGNVEMVIFFVASSLAVPMCFQMYNKYISYPI